MGREAKYVVRLDEDKRIELRQMVDRGLRSKSVRQRARVLLKADEGEGAPAWSDERVAEFSEVSLSTVHRVRQRFVEEGFQAAVFRKPSSNRLYPFGSVDEKTFPFAWRTLAKAPEIQGLCFYQAWIMRCFCLENAR